jgi:hypothetical protein
MPQNIFDFHFEFAKIFEFESGSEGYLTPQNKKPIFKIVGSLSMDQISLG